MLELPKLPKAEVTTDTHIDGKGHPAFTVDQMHAHAALASDNALEDAALKAEAEGYHCLADDIRSAKTQGEKP